MIDIKGYEGLYAITSCGKVWGYKRKHFLKPQIDEGGYLWVNLCKDGKTKHTLIHRLVAEAYIPNPDNLPQVNHKDEVKNHNYINNLEWCSKDYNNNYGTRNARMAQKQQKPVYCVEMDKVFNSMKEAGETLNINKDYISACCRGKQKTACGYHFRYAEMEVAK